MKDYDGKLAEKMEERIRQENKGKVSKSIETFTKPQNPPPLQGKTPITSCKYAFDRNCFHSKTPESKFDGLSSSVWIVPTFISPYGRCGHQSVCRRVRQIIHQQSSTGHSAPSDVDRDQDQLQVPSLRKREVRPKRQWNGFGRQQEEIYQHLHDARQQKQEGDDDGRERDGRHADADICRRESEEAEGGGGDNVQEKVEAFHDDRLRGRGGKESAHGAPEHRGYRSEVQVRADADRKDCGCQKGHVESK